MLPFDNDSEAKERGTLRPDEVPLIYVASPLTRASSEEERRTILFQIDKIVTSISERTSGGAPLFRTHAPAVHSSPWAAEGATPAQIFERNTSLILTEADAVIVGV